MKTPMLASLALFLSVPACVDSEESVPDVFAPTEEPPSWRSVSDYSVASELVADQQLAISGHLEGTLRGITLSADTSENYGSYSAYEGEPSYFSANIAAVGDGGAGMLIIGLFQADLSENLLDGHWSGSSRGGTYSDGSSASSCAGPALGQWPYEIGSTDYEIDATEDPVRPGTVVLAVKAHFPLSEADQSATTELTGTLRFELPAASD